MQRDRYTLPGGRREIHLSSTLYDLSYEIKRAHQHRILTVIMAVVSVFVAVTLITTFWLLPVRQTSVSMEPDIAPGSHVLVSLVEKKLVRGSVVLLKPLHPRRETVLIRFINRVCLFFTAQQYTPFSRRSHMGEHDVLRRVVGVPGDTLYLRDYIAFIRPSGERHFLTEFELSPRPYNVTIMAAPAGWENAVGVSGTTETVTLGDGEYFVLGDNRRASLDSRVWGIVGADDITACAVALYYPFSRVRRL
ncbi:MAG: signal peptidase I [Treponema sp.]|nr:signal peptidase I [Treponema sp.]